MMKLIKKSIILSLLLVFSSLFFHINAGVKKEVKLSQEISTNEWIKLDGKASVIFLEFLDGQDEAWVKTEKMKIAQKLDNGKYHGDRMHSDSKDISINQDVEQTKSRNLSKIIEIGKSQWIKVESKGRVIVYGWVDEQVLDKGEKLLTYAENQVAKLTGDVKIISRKQWGADESIRYNYSDDAKNSPPSYNVNAWDARCNNGAKGKDETKYAKIIYNENGNSLLWPYQYSNRIKKIVVHHTAESDKSYNLPGDQKIRSIYKYHTLTRGWGDIGYHYIIDQKGNIYQGRSGGDYVVGAHAKCNNVGTISVSLMGNFQNQNPTSAQLTSLAKLIAKLGMKYSLDPSTYGYFHGQKTSNILGHRDLGSTACPGDNMYKKLPNIAKQIELADFNFEFKEVKESGANIAEVKTGVDVIEMPPSTSKIITFTYKNTGTETWSKGTWLYVSDNTNRDLNVSSIFADKNYVAANLQEDKVYPGGVGHFNVEVNSGYKQGLYSLEFIPIINGVTKFTKGTIIQPIKVSGAENSYQFLQLKAPPKEIYAGQSFTAKIKLENSGNTTWHRSGNNAMTIKTYPQNRESKFVIKEDGYDTTILARLVEPSVSPGEIGTFEFSLRAPLDHGDYGEKFIPVIGDDLILGDRSMQFDIKVKKPNYRAQLLRESRENEFLTGEKKTVRLGLKNLSDVFWEAEQVSFKVVKSGGLKFDSYDYFIPEFVPKHQAGFANVTIQAPKKPGKYTATLQALANGKKFERLGRFELEIIVTEANLNGILTYQSQKQLFLKKGETEKVTVRIKNKTDKTWYKNGANRISSRTTNNNSPLFSEKRISKNIVAEMKEAKVSPGNTATFEIYVKANKEGRFTENFFIRANSVGTIKGGEFSITVISGEKLKSSKSTEQVLNYQELSLKEKIELLRNRRSEILSSSKEVEKEILAKKETIVQEKIPETSSEENKDEISVRLSFPHNAVRLAFNGYGKIFLDEKEIKINNDSVVWTRSDGDYKMILNVDSKLYRGKEVKALAYNGSFVKLANWDHSPAWSNSINDNFYRGKILIRAIDNQVKGQLDVINKLGFEKYLRGIAEVPESSSNEKRKALAVVARSYAMHYTKTKWRKFPGKSYDASDSPNVFQKYLGAGYELRSPKWQKAIEDTKGEILSYNGDILKTAYFSCSNGKTKTPVEANWNSEYFREVAEVYKSVDDTYGMDLNRYNSGLCGHGVGLSGLGAENLAKLGWSYKRILYYYYQNVNLEKR